MGEWVKGGKEKQDEERGFEDWIIQSEGRSGIFFSLLVESFCMFFSFLGK